MERYLTDPNAEYFVNFEVKLKHDCVWAPAGHVVATEQFALNEKINKPSEIKTDTPGNEILKAYEEERRYVRFENNNCGISFDMATGQMIGLRYGAQEVLHRQQVPNLTGIAPSTTIPAIGPIRKSNFRISHGNKPKIRSL